MKNTIPLIHLSLVTIPIKYNALPPYSIILLGANKANETFTVMRSMFV